MNNDLVTKSTKKKLHSFMLITMLILFSVYLILSMVYDVVCSDILFSTTVLPRILKIVAGLCDIATYGVCFAVFILSAYTFGIKASIPFVCTYSAAVLLKYLLSLGLYSLVFKSTPYITDFIYLLIIWCVEVIFAILVAVIVNISISKQTKKSAEFKKTFSTSNPIQVTSLSVGIFVSATKLIQRIIRDIGYRAPDSIAEIVWMAVAYLSDIVICFIFYFICNSVIKYLFKKFSI